MEDLSSSIDRAVTENKPITLTGDYNFDCLIEKERQYLDTILTPYGLEVIHRNEATHIQGELMSSIDYIITDHEKSSDFNSNVADTPLRTSKNKGIGHFATTLVTNFEMKKAKSVTQKKVYDKSTYDKEKFQHLIQTSDWGYSYAQTCAEGMFFVFVNIFDSALQMCIRKKIVFFRNDKSCLTIYQKWVKKKTKTMYNDIKINAEPIQSFYLD